ncbi:unnamed protein product [Coffea canephora]|uniref:Uncharacterized protein n=1 Tax=Coffea canephora TaxID=49390 RepID=A0A068TYA6_COFCA|nr:unnamed protein product [Coffea canephora]
MQFSSLISFHLLVLQCLCYLCIVQSHDFLFFVQMWPGAYCDTKRTCCYPAAGKPTDFTIHRLWPVFNNVTFPEDCNPNSHYNETKKSTTTKFWTHEWTKHGTCALPVLDQHGYFAAALSIKDKVNILQVLKNAGIQPDGTLYKLDDIKEAIKAGTGYIPVIECNTNASGNIQLYQVYLCVDAAGSDLIECPVTLKRACNTSVEFPIILGP